jgi:SurA N-terminal domain
MNEVPESVVDSGVETVAPTPTPTSNPKKKKSNMLRIIIALVLLAILGALATKFMAGGSTDGKKSASLDPAAIVASVNGVNISRAELNKKIDQVKSTVPEGTADPSQDAAFELQLLDEVVNLKLLVSTAEAKGFTVTDEDIQKEVASLTEAFGGETEFQKQLQDNNLTIEDLRENMHNELLIRQLVDSETAIKGVAVTPEEIKKTYDEAMTGAPEGQDVPPLEEVTEMIRAQLLQQKSAAIVQEYINTLREGAKIDILL